MDARRLPGLARRRAGQTPDVHVLIHVIVQVRGKWLRTMGKSLIHPRATLMK
jgi:hypothetical protein